jgi:hypothetical protein
MIDQQVRDHLSIKPFPNKVACRIGLARAMPHPKVSRPACGLRLTQGLLF